ncbi:MAG: DUF6020 family protein [Lachnospiraceae bacterium]|nr:DUF6020 family protein [Lachnospiraceae bacterium]
MKSIDIRKLNIVELVYSLAFAVMTVLSRHTTYSDKIESSILTVNMTSFRLIDILIFVIVTTVVYVLLQILKIAIDKLSPFVWQKDEQIKNNKVVCWLIVFAVIMICYIPYMMSYWPGGIYNDTLDSIDIALGKSAWSNQNTILYALLWKLIFAAGSVVKQGDYGGLKLMTVVQPMALAAMTASFITWLRNRGVRRWVVILLTAIVAVFPVFPYYGVSLWKETWFGLAFFAYTWMWFAMCERLREVSSVGGSIDDKGQVTNNKNLFSIKEVSLYTISTLWIIFGRNNGLYVALFVMTVSSIVFFARIERSVWKKVIAVNIVLIVTSLLIQGPLFGLLGIKKSLPAESLGIPLQQTAYMIGTAAVENTIADVVIEDTNQAVRECLRITDAEYDVITSIMPVESWILQYNPVVVDSLKFSKNFNKEYFGTHTGDFLMTYISLACKNPKYAIRGYLISTMGFWDAYKSSSSAYICTAHTSQAEYFMSDYFNMKTDKYLSDIVGPRWYISGGAFVWIMLSLCVIAGNKVKNNIPKTEGDESKLTVRSDNRCALSTGISVLTFLPAVALWLTYMLATPLSFSFRYLFGLLLCIPLYILAVLSE